MGEAFAGALADAQTRTIGDAVRTALEVFAVDGYYPFVSQIYTLIGDPATVIPRSAAADPSLFSDDFESGDTSAWSAVVP